VDQTVEIGGQLLTPGNQCIRLSFRRFEQLQNLSLAIGDLRLIR
jgi:hypothetical protein